MGYQGKESLRTLNMGSYRDIMYVIDRSLAYDYYTIKGPRHQVGQAYFQNFPTVGANYGDASLDRWPYHF